MSKLKFDPKTLSVLKSFSLINGSMIFKEGDTLITVSPTKSIAARATVPVNIEKKFVVYSLSRFLNTLSMFKDPEIDIGDKTLQIKDSSEKRNVHYALSNEMMVPIPSIKDPSFPEGDIKFVLTVENLKEVEKALGVLELPDIVIGATDGKIFVQAGDIKNPTSDTYSVEVGESNQNFKAIFSPESLGVLSRVLTDRYEVDISSKGFAHFKADGLEYWILLNASSTFE